MNLFITRSSAALVAATLLLTAAPAAASVNAHRASGPQRAFVPGEVIVRTGTPDSPRVKVVRTMQPVLQKAAELAERPGVLSATPNWIARVSAFVPNDPGRAATPGGWQALQWNFLPEAGVNAPEAWDNLNRVGRPGATGVIVAVLDTGVAYADRGHFRRSPDLSKRTFVKGYDFVDNDPYPMDHNGHGTHVASTIAEAANNNVGVTGLAYGARIMPVRVLDRLGEGDSLAIAAGIRFAVRRGAQIINLSFEFSSSVTRRQIPDILDAIRYARRKRVLVVGASGNAARAAVAYPARASEVLSVGATTEHLCQADYSNEGEGLDIAAPGGGPDAELPTQPQQCRPLEEPGRDIFQMTFTRSVRQFGLPAGNTGTSMAAPHVSAIAAMVIASGVIGAKPSPKALESHLKRTARDLGDPGYDTIYGAGLVDAAAATRPPAQTPPPAEPTPTPAPPPA
jgi:serine protease